MSRKGLPFPGGAAGVKDGIFTNTTAGSARSRKPGSRRGDVSDRKKGKGLFKRESFLYDRGMNLVRM